jgi:hypothetical protein
MPGVAANPHDFGPSPIIVGLSAADRRVVIAQAATMLDQWRDVDIIRMPGTAHLAVSTRQAAPEIEGASAKARRYDVKDERDDG